MTQFAAKLRRGGVTWRGTSLSTLLHGAIVLLLLFGIPALPALFDRSGSAGGTPNLTEGGKPGGHPGRQQLILIAPPPGQDAVSSGTVDIVVVPEGALSAQVRGLLRDRPRAEPQEPKPAAAGTAPGGRASSAAGTAGPQATAPPAPAQRSPALPAGPPSPAQASLPPATAVPDRAPSATTAAPPPPPTAPARSPEAVARALARIDPVLRAVGGTAARPADSPRRRARRQKVAARLQRGAELGHRAAQYNLAVMLLNGDGTARDPARARDWLVRAAETGSVRAQLLLGFLAAGGGSGGGLRGDPGEADFWWWAAERRGSALAKQARALLDPMMSPDDVIRSRRRQAEWTAMRTMLLRLGGIGNGGDGAEDALRAAAASGDIEALLAALADGADADGRDFDGRTAMINAAWRGRREVIRVLMEQGANIDLVDDGGRTPLMWAAINGHTAVIDQLVAAGGDPDERDAEKRTALMRAAWNGHLAIVDKLLRAGARADLRDRDGRTAEAFARREGHAAIVERLRRPGSGGPR